MKSDSNPGSPHPSDDPFRADDRPADEDVIDFNRVGGADDTSSSAAMSFAARSGPLSGSSVISWEQLVRQQASDSGENISLYDSAGDAAIDPISDQDLLREVLADEPPPSKIIYKDPSGIDLPALKPKARDAGRADAAAAEAPAGSFALPPELEATRPDQPASGPEGGPADSWAGSSRVDLLGARVIGLSSGSLSHTDELDDPPLVRPVGDEGLSGESSAVSLGPDAAHDLPFPLGVDSSVGSSLVRPGPASAGGADSGAVDLLGEADAFGLDLRPGTSSLTPGLGLSTSDLPPTVPLVPAGQGRAGAWVGGGLAGLVAGVAACAGLWYAGVVPPADPGRPARAAAQPVAAVAPDDAALAEGRRAVEAADQLKAQLGALTANLRQASIDPQNPAAAVEQGRKAQADLARLNTLFRQADLDPAALPGVAVQLAQARAAADDARQARAKLDAVAAQVRAAKLDPTDLPGAVRQLADARPAAPAADAGADARLARLRDEFTQAQEQSRAAEAGLRARVDQLAAAQAKLAEFFRSVANRLQAAKLVAPDAKPADVLAGLDRALDRRPDAPPPAAPATPERAASAISNGWSAYTSGDHYRAEQHFAAAAAAGERSAIPYYYLGLARAGAGQYAAADAAFRQGAALERQNQPNPGEVDRALERLPTASRRLVNSYRR